jgi:hypothetical protein
MAPDHSRMFPLHISMSRDETTVGVRIETREARAFGRDPRDSQSYVDQKAHLRQVLFAEVAATGLAIDAGVPIGLHDNNLAMGSNTVRTLIEQHQRKL